MGGINCFFALVLLIFYSLGVIMEWFMIALRPGLVSGGICSVWVLCL